jgi:hypothetical protein
MSPPCAPLTTFCYHLTILSLGAWPKLQLSDELAQSCSCTGLNISKHKDNRYLCRASSRPAAHVTCTGSCLASKRKGAMLGGGEARAPSQSPHVLLDCREGL